VPLTSSIKPYDPTWPQQYAAEEARLKPVFGSGLIGIHHVGSTAVSDWRRRDLKLRLERENTSVIQQ